MSWETATSSQRTLWPRLSTSSPKHPARAKFLNPHKSKLSHLRAGKSSSCECDCQQVRAPRCDLQYINNVTFQSERLHEIQLSPGAPHLIASCLIQTGDSCIIHRFLTACFGNLCQLCFLLAGVFLRKGRAPDSEHGGLHRRAQETAGGARRD